MEVQKMMTDFKTHYKIIVIKMVGQWYKNRTKEPDGPETESLSYSQSYS